MHVRALTLPLSLALFAAPVLPSAIAQEAAPAHIKEQPPAPAPARPFHLAPRTRYTLPNGFTVNLLEYGTVPKVYIDVDVAAGKVNEDPQHTNLSVLTAELMSEGTTSLTGEQIAQRAGDMGSTLSASGGAYQSSFAMDVLSNNAAEAIGLLGDVLEHPAFPEKDFERHRTDALRQRATALANPGFLGRQKFAEIMYGDQAYGRLVASEAMLKSYTLDDVHGFYKANFGAQRTTIYVVGHFDEKAVRAAIEKAFKGWERGPAVAWPDQKAASGAHFAFIDQPGAAQSNVIYGIPVANVDSPDATQLEVMNSLLGGSFGSRITANIREQKGYTYSPYSSLSQGYGTNIWAESAAITTVSTGPAITEIQKEIKRLQDEPPSATELQNIQRYEDGVFILRNSSRQGILSNLSFVDFHHLKDSYLTGYVDRINAVTPGQVQEMAKKYLHIEGMTLVVVGDPAVVKPQLASFTAGSN
ncbi:M16 family metallopeptidase [Silvibacterium dinghuense]|uniref:Insulinase family protein n=1 Tax=Silvibacterium dinghuense TaxID=1560006 RepID=A0A4Q1SE75_9BACT|nr:pitrilysin family protein [Silvibacterium dinghuense]RXS95417.1 insulinase family protein [Silvibacterium dinghuense]GGH13055.1 peptidase M16 [Silvibacterium dinghuense]